MLSSIKAKVMRLTAIDDAGNPAVGERSTLVTGGFIGLTPTPEYERGEAVWRRNLWGVRCGTTRRSDELSRINLSILLCGVDPEATAFLGEGVDELFDTESGLPIGIAFAEGRAAAPRYALEVWSRVPSDCADDEWVYWCFPRLRAGAVAGWTLDYGPASFQVEASTEPATAGWGAGPYLPAPGPTGFVVPTRAHATMIRTTVPPPTATAGLVALTA